ncbi:hypothetical protein ES703_03381 [subsurface metagenome]
MKGSVLITFLISLLLCITGCAKRGIIVTCPEGDYEAFLDKYMLQCKIDSFSGNGSFDINKLDNEFFGNFSIFYSKKPRRWGITLYGLFGMVLLQTEIKNDSFSIFSPMLDKPVKGSVNDFNIEDYTGIPISPISVPFLTTGRVLLDTLQLPSYCIKKNENLIEFIFEAGSNNKIFGWSSLENRIEYYMCGKKERKELLEVKFKDFRNIDTISLPYSILFIYKGKEEAHLKLNYRYIDVNPN